MLALRGMLAVPYFEKALYELPEEQLTVEALVQLADRIEADLQGGLSPRPLLSVREGGDWCLCSCRWTYKEACHRDHRAQ